MRRSYCFIVRDEERKEGGRGRLQCSVAANGWLQQLCKKLKEFAR